MQYDVIVTIIASALFAIIGVLAYRQGVKDGRAIKDNKPLEEIKPKVLPMFKVEKKDAVEDYYNKVMANLNNYNGSSEGQIDV